MVDPISLGLSAATLSQIGTGATVLGGVTGAVSKLFGGKAQSDMYQYQAGMAEINRQIKVRDAAYTRHAGELDAQRVGMKERFEEGQTKVLQSGRGLDVNTGSPADVRESMGDIGRQDQATIRASAARKAYGFDVEAEKYAAQGSMMRTAAKKAKTSAGIEAMGSLLGAATGVASKWLDASRVGIGEGRGISLTSPDFPYEAWSG